MEQSPLFSRSSITSKLPTYTEPAGAPFSEAEQQAYRDLIVDFVCIAWRKLHRPVSLQEIYSGAAVTKYGVQQEWIMGVRERVESRIANDLWPYAKFPRGKRSVDRRVNECSADQFCPDNTSFLACNKPGIYQVNPKRLEASK